MEVHVVVIGLFFHGSQKAFCRACRPTANIMAIVYQQCVRNTHYHIKNTEQMNNWFRTHGLDDNHDFTGVCPRICTVK